MSPSNRPVGPITIEPAFYSSDFYVSSNRHVRELNKFRGDLTLLLDPEYPITIPNGVPIAVFNPFSTLVRMSAICPSPQLPVQHRVQVCKDTTSRVRPMVMSPSQNHWIESLYEKFNRSLPKELTQAQIEENERINFVIHDWGTNCGVTPIAPTPYPNTPNTIAASTIAAIANPSLGHP